jgi:hypothetical protein
MIWRERSPAVSIPLGRLRAASRVYYLRSQSGAELQRSGTIRGRYGRMPLATSGIEYRVDPSYIAIGSPIHKVQLAMRPVTKQQYRRTRQIQPHHGLAYG